MNGSAVTAAGAGWDSITNADWLGGGAAPNTGSGGGSVGRWGYKAGAGGAGIVIIRYEVAA